MVRLRAAARAGESAVQEMNEGQTGEPQVRVTAVVGALPGHAAAIDNMSLPGSDKGFTMSLIIP